jgi:hypothetical protein
MRNQAHKLMAARSWPAVAKRYTQLVSATRPAASTQLRFAPRADGERAFISTHRSGVYAEASNGIMAMSASRNENWVDGVGPGWYPTDTFLSRHRPVWGVDSLIMSGCFIRQAPARALPARHA